MPRQVFQKLECLPYPPVRVRESWNIIRSAVMRRRFGVDRTDLVAVQHDRTTDRSFEPGHCPKRAGAPNEIAATLFMQSKQAVAVIQIRLDGEIVRRQWASRWYESSCLVAVDRIFAAAKETEKRAFVLPRIETSKKSNTLLDRFVPGFYCHAVQLPVICAL